MAEGSLKQRLQLAVQYQTSGRWAEAEAIYRQVLEADPANADALHMLGMLAYQAGRPEAALELIGRAAALAPNWAAVHSNLGLVHLELRQLGQAEAALRRALEVNSIFAPALANLGAVLHQQGRIQESVVLLRRAAAVSPQNPQVQHNLGVALQQQGKFEESLAAEEAALRLNPGYPEAWNGRALALRELDRIDQAIASLRQALALRGDYVEAMNNLAGVLQSVGQVDAAVELYRRSLQIRPSASVHSNLLYAILFQRGDEPGPVFDEHVRWAREYTQKSRDEATKTSASSVEPRPGHDGKAGRRLNIGYVSAHFRRHAVAVFMEPVLAAHDHSAVQVFCYSDVRCPDEVTGRFKAHADVWREAAGLSDGQLADLIRADGIDILVDLAGHIAGNRLLAFARQPAPIHVTYLGYQATTGLATMDYRLTDAVADPPGQTEAFHTEKLVRLPRAFFCYRPPVAMPAVNDLPALSAGHVTFASMNNFAKVSPKCLAVWARLLKAVPDSRLILLVAGGAENAGRVLPVFTQAGVAASRIEFVGRLGLHQYMEMYRRIDILLDPMPFSGHTTTCDALWMGVPVVTLAGPAYVSRMTASVLAHLPLPELIAQSGDEYVTIAAELAGDLDRLAGLRARLRGMMEASSVADAAGLARDLEAAYRRMGVA